MFVSFYFSKQLWEGRYAPALVTLDPSLTFRFITCIETLNASIEQGFTNNPHFHPQNMDILYPLFFN